MSKQFTAMIPARKVGKFSYAARNDVYTLGDDGNWTVDQGFGEHNVSPDDVTASCKNATNWDEIRATYFPMYGFHKE